MKEQEWLDALKPGDEVAMAVGGYGLGRGFNLRRVERRTDSGRIILDTGTVFNANGNERGGRRWLREPTAELKSELDTNDRTNKALGRLNQVRWRELPLETLEAICALLTAKDEGSET